MIAMVLVSHSPEVARGTKALAEQMTQGRVKVYDAGGVDDHTIGTNVERILDAINAAMNDDGVLVLLDLGSAALSAQMAVEMLPEDQQQRVKISEAPLVEGAIIGAVEASLGHPLAKVNEAAEATSTLRKLP